MLSVPHPPPPRTKYLLHTWVELQSIGKHVTSCFCSVEPLLPTLFKWETLHTDPSTPYQLPCFMSFIVKTATSTEEIPSMPHILPKKTWGDILASFFSLSCKLPQMPLVNYRRAGTGRESRGRVPGLAQLHISFHISSTGTLSLVFCYDSKPKQRLKTKHIKCNSIPKLILITLILNYEYVSISLQSNRYKSSTALGICGNNYW